MATDSITTHFFDLPGEIRNTIYKYCFGDLAFHYCSPDFIRDARRFTNTRWSTTLFSVNHRVREEALSAFSDNLTVFCDFDNLNVWPLQHPKFILANLTKLVVHEDRVLTVPWLEGRVERWRKMMPKLKTLSILLRNPMATFRCHWEIFYAWHVPPILAVDDLISFLRGSFTEYVLLQDGPVENVHFDGMAKGGVRLMWRFEPECEMKRICLRYLYRIDFAPAAWRIHTRRINVSQSRSYTFGKWVPAEDVTLLIDQVSAPVVWSVKHGMGRVLTNRIDLMQQVEEELEDPERLARALERGFSCASPTNRKSRRLVSTGA